MKCSGYVVLLAVIIQKIANTRYLLVDLQKEDGVISGIHSRVRVPNWTDFAENQIPIESERGTLVDQHESIRPLVPIPERIFNLMKYGCGPGTVRPTCNLVIMYILNQTSPYTISYREEFYAAESPSSDMITENHVAGLSTMAAVRIN